MTYMLWQIADIKQPLPENIRKALEFHEKKYGRAPNIVEYSHELECPQMNGILFRPISIPKNILLVGVEIIKNESNQSQTNQGH